MHELKKQKKQKQQNSRNIQIDLKNIPQNNKKNFLEYLLKNNLILQKQYKQNNNNYYGKIILKNNQSLQKYNHLLNNNNKYLLFNKYLFKQKSNKKYINTSQQIKKNIDKINLSKKLNKQSFQNHLLQNNTSSNISISKFIKNKYIKNIHHNLSIQSNSIHKNKYHYLYQPKSARTSQFLTDQQISNKNYLQENNKLYNKPSQQKTQNTSKRQSFSPHLQKSSQNTSHQISKNSTKKQRQKIIQINNKIKQKTQLQKQITLLVNKLLKLFQLKLQGQKLIKLSFHQLIKIIQNIYNWIYQNNHHYQHKKKYNQKTSFSNPSNNNHLFVQFVKQFFITKFTHQKQGISNLINMLYSLSLYLQMQKKYHNTHSICSQKFSSKQLKTYFFITSSGIYIKIFEDFLYNIYQYQDLLFYLFVRNIIINQINLSQSYNKIKIQHHFGGINHFINQIDIIFNNKDINKILKLILANDEQLVKQYTQIIIQYIKQSLEKQYNQIKQIIKISCPQFIYLLLDNYKKKRMILQSSINSSKNIKQSNINQQTSSNTLSLMLKRGFSKYRDNQVNRRTKSGSLRNDNQTNQLTFGEQTQDHQIQQLISINSNNDIKKKSFWQPNFDYKLQNKYQPNSIEEIMFNKMKKKVKQFINILIENRSQYNSIDVKRQKMIKQQNNQQSSHWLQLLMKKSLSLLRSIINMNKIQWFDDLRVENPSQQDVDKVESLQLAYRKIKENPEPDQIVKLCKSILTTPQLTSSLQKLMDFESESNQIF